MIGALFCCIIVCIIAWILTYFQEKYTYLALILTFISIAALIFPIISFFTDYDPLHKIKEIMLSKQNTIVSEENLNTTSSSSTSSSKDSPSPTIEVVPSNKTNYSIDNLNDDKKQNNINKAVILNIGDRTYRDDNNMIKIKWTPIEECESYKIKLEVDDPFIESKIKEFSTEENWIDIDMSDYQENSVFFISVAIFDIDSSEWIYSEPIHSILY